MSFSSFLLFFWADFWLFVGLWENFLVYISVYFHIYVGSYLSVSMRVISNICLFFSCPFLFFLFSRGPTSTVSMKVSDRVKQTVSTRENDPPPTYVWDMEYADLISVQLGPLNGFCELYIWQRAISTPLPPPLRLGMPTLLGLALQFHGEWRRKIRSPESMVSGREKALRQMWWWLVFVHEKRKLCGTPAVISSLQCLVFRLSSFTWNCK